MNEGSCSCDCGRSALLSVVDPTRLREWTDPVCPLRWCRLVERSRRELLWLACVLPGRTRLPVPSRNRLRCAMRRGRFFFRSYMASFVFGQRTRTSSFQWFDHAPDCDTPFYKNCRSCGCPSAARGAESSANRRRCRQCGRGSMFSSLKKSGAKTDSVYSLRHFSADSGALTRRNLGDGRTDVPDY